MSFTTVAFFVFLLAGIVVYYVLPKNVQWIWLLILSYIYYFTFSIKASLFMVFATVTIYFGGIWLQNIQNAGDRYLKDNKETLSREDMGSGTLTTTDTKEKVRYTSAKEIEYAQSATQVCLNWDQAEALAKGVYQVEIYNKGYKCGEGSFKLK